MYIYILHITSFSLRLCQYTRFYKSRLLYVKTINTCTVNINSQSMLLSYFTVSGCPHSKTGFHLTYFKKNGTHCQDKMRTIFWNVFCYSTRKPPMYGSMLDQSLYELGVKLHQLSLERFYSQKQWTGDVSLLLLCYFYAILCYLIKDLRFNIYTCTWWWLGQAETCSILAQP
jgi:hypothetical protein